MSYLISFQSQLSSVMEILVKAAITEASKTVEGIFTDFQIEIDKHIKENENLKRKVLGSATEKELEYVHGTESMDDHASKYRSVGIQVDCRAVICAEDQDCCWRKIDHNSNLVVSDQWNHHCSCNTTPAARRPVYFTVERAEAVSRPIKVESLDPNQLSIDLEPQEELRSRGKRAEESTVLLHDRLPIGQQPSEEEWAPSLSQPAQLSPAQVLNNDSQDEQKSDVHHGLGLGHTVLSMHTIAEASCHDQLDFGVISEQASTWDGGPIPAVHTAEGEMPARSGFNVEGRFLEQDKKTTCHELQWPCVGKSLADLEGNTVQQLYSEEDTGERCHREEEDNFQSGEQRLNITANLMQLKKYFSSRADGPLHCPELLVPSYGHVSPASAENTGLGGSAYNYNQCRECGKNFRTQRTLKTHLRIHARERTYECSVCGRSFCNLDHLRTHQLVHTRQKPFVCSLCGKSFGLLGNLKTHQRIHTGEKPYSCPECGRSFSHQQNLDTHLRIHTGEKPYSCTHCGKNFSILQNLKTHIRIHTGEKPYSCTLCGKCFTQLSNLRTHQRTRACERPQTKY